MTTKTKLPRSNLLYLFTKGGGPPPPPPPPPLSLICVRRGGGEGGAPHDVSWTLLGELSEIWTKVVCVFFSFRARDKQTTTPKIGKTNQSVEDLHRLRLKSASKRWLPANLRNKKFVDQPSTSALNMQDDSYLNSLAENVQSAFQKKITFSRNVFVVAYHDLVPRRNRHLYCSCFWQKTKKI